MFATMEEDLAQDIPEMVNAKEGRPIVSRLIGLKVSNVRNAVAKMMSEHENACTKDNFIRMKKGDVSLSA